VSLLKRITIGLLALTTGVVGVLWFVHAEIDTCWDVNLRLSPDADTLVEFAPLAADYAARWNPDAYPVSVAVLYPDESVDFLTATVRFAYGAEGRKLWRPHYVTGIVEIVTPRSILSRVYTIGGGVSSREPRLCRRSCIYGVQDYDQVMAAALESGGYDFIADSESQGHIWDARANLFYYWFVRIKNDGQQHFEAVIDPKTKEVVETSFYGSGYQQD